jgi:hypothetical protein
MLDISPLLDEVVVIGCSPFKESQLIAVPLVLDLKVDTKLNINRRMLGLSELLVLWLPDRSHVIGIPYKGRGRMIRSRGALA